MNNQSVKRILILVVIIMIVAGIYYVGIPYFQRERSDGILKQVVIRSTTEDKQPLYLKVNDLTVKTEIADDVAKREQGLSGQGELRENEAMLFVFDKPGYYQMWMKNMYFPIDILWLDSDFQVIYLKKNVEPSTYPDSFGPPTPALYVVELKGGMSDKYGIKMGDVWTLADVKLTI